MRHFFIPAIALMSRLNYTRKFLLLWALFLAAVAMVTSSLYASLDKEISNSRRELEGIALARPISRAVQIIQQHRGLSAALLGGDGEMRARGEMGKMRAAREKEIVDVFAALEQQLPPNLAASADWRSIRTNWARLREEGLALTIEANLVAHTRLIEQLLFFRVVVSGEYVLPLDPQIDTAYLIDATLNRLPLALEHLGQIRAQGSAILAKRQVAEHEKVRINTLIAQLGDEVKFFCIDLERVGGQNPALRDALSAVSGKTASLTRQIVDQVASDIVDGHFTASPESFFKMATGAIDTGYAQMYETLLPMIETLIQERIASAENELRTSIGIALLLALVVAYFAAGIYYATTGSIQSLARSARAFVGGNLHERVDLGARDELKQVGDSFNEMADGFGALLEERKRAMEALRESETRLRAIFEQAAVGIAQVAPDGRWLDVNQRLCDIVGYAREELLATTFQDITHPDDLDADLGYVHQMLAREIQTYSMEKRYFRKDGAVVWINLTVSLVREPSGEPGYFISVVEDITERKQADAALRESEERFRAYVEQAADALFVHDFLGRFTDVNQRACDSLGYSRDELLRMTVFDVETDFDLARAQAAWRQIQPRQPFALPGHQRRKDGTIFPVEVQFGCFDLKGERYYMGLARDITERKQAEQALIESSERFHSVIETAMDAMVQMDEAGVITGWNRQAASMFGWSQEEAMGRMLHELIIPSRHRASHVQGMKHFLASGESAVLSSRIESEGLHRDGHEFPVELSITAIKTAGRYEFNGFIRDITQRKSAEDLIWKQANFDTLTGLPNRRMFHDRLAQEIKKAARAGTTMALLFIDLDRFKEVNDTLGHSMGDLLLVETARRIGDCVREADTVARFGGDEFIALLTELEGKHSIERVAESVLQKLAEPFKLGNEVVYVSASIGITLYPDDATEIEYLLKDADQAMYVAKKTGRNRISYFTPELQEAAQARREIINDLHGALAGNQFQVYYQPIVDLATGRIYKAEALIRWQHPVRGMVSPAEFIPLAEETGLIIDIGDWVFRETAQQVMRWRERYNPELQISVNESPVQFRSDSSVRGAWPAYLQELGLPGQSMVIEITEGLLLNAEPEILNKLLQFHNAGIQISLDDFGTGYSSLAYLQKFNLDYLKIDQSFTRNLAPDSNSLALSEAIIVMAHKLGMKVIAEGVESAQQRELLSAAGCDYGQGYLFSRPVPAGEFELLLQVNSG